MSYEDFNVRRAMDKLGCRVQELGFLSTVRPVEPSADLLAALKLLGGPLVVSSEKSRSEALIAPILSEAAQRTRTRLFSGENFDVDSEQGLVGFVDFLFSRSAPGKTIVDPVLCIAEAKRADMDSHAFGQCIATMIAAHRFNRDKQAPVFGCVTTGHDWQFLRLQKDLVDIDPQVYFQDRLDLILGILVSFLQLPA